MKKNSGFTLIELLAVLVVLAILAAVITPQISKSIEQSKMKTAIESANGVIRTVESYMISSNKKYGKVDLLSSDLKYSGAKPQAGEAEINKEGKIRLYTYFNNYCVTKEYDKEPYATKMSKELCGWFATDNYENKENESGSVLTFDSNDTNNEVVNYIIKGNSTQETRSGKNILNMANFTTSFTNSYYENKATNFKLTAGKTYTLSFNYRVNSAGAALSTGVGYGTSYYSADIVYGKAYPNQTSGRQSVTFTVPSNLADGNYLFVRFARTGSSTSASVVISSIQLEEGEKATTYEPYGAMPSIEFPSEISSTGDLLTTGNCASYGSDACDNIGKYVIPVKVSGKNIFDVNSWYNWLRTFTTQYVAKETVDGIEAIRYQPPVTYNKPWMQGQFKENTKYTFSYKAKGIVGTNKSTGFKFVYTDGTTTACYVDNEATWKNYTCASSGKTIDRLEMNYFYGQGCYFDINSIQLEESSAATTYEAYNGKTTNIYLDEPLRKVGNYVDYIDYNNKKIVRNVKERVYTGKEYWYADGTSYVFDSTGTFIKSTKGSLLSNIAFYASTKNNDNFNFARSGAGYIEFNALNKGYTVATWKQYLVNKYNSGSPVKVQYDIATPEEQTIDLPSIESNGNIRNVSLGCNTAASSISFSITK